MLKIEVKLLILDRKIGPSYTCEWLRGKRIPNANGIRCNIFTIIQPSQSYEAWFCGERGRAIFFDMRDQRDCHGFYALGQTKWQTCSNICYSGDDNAEARQNYALQSIFALIRQNSSLKT